MKRLLTRTWAGLVLGVALAGLAAGLVVWQQQRRAASPSAYFKVEVTAVKISAELREKFAALTAQGRPLEIAQSPGVTVQMSPASTVRNGEQIRFFSANELCYPTEFERQRVGEVLVPYPTQLESRIVGWALTMNLRQHKARVFLRYKYENTQYLGSEELPPKGCGILVPKLRVLTGENFSATVPLNREVLLFAAEPPPQDGAETKVAEDFLALIAKISLAEP